MSVRKTSVVGPLALGSLIVGSGLASVLALPILFPRDIDVAPTADRFKGTPIQVENTFDRSQQIPDVQQVPDAQLPPVMTLMPDRTTPYYNPFALPEEATSAPEATTPDSDPNDAPPDAAPRPIAVAPYYNPYLPPAE